jgi:hypothetical protein
MLLLVDPPSDDDMANLCGGCSACSTDHDVVPWFYACCMKGKMVVLYIAELILKHVRSRQ